MSDKAETTEYGHGVMAKIENGKLFIAIDLEGDFGLSGSGKNLIVATTAGNQAIAHGNVQMRFGLNVFRTPTPSEKKEALLAAAAE